MQTKTTYLFNTVGHLAIVAACFFWGASCRSFHKNKSHAGVSDASIAAGKRLAGQYCQSCHQLPDPSLLDASHWEQGVLPQMGPRLGIFEYNFSYYPSERNDPNLNPHYYPDSPLLNPAQWQQLIDYYTSLSPDSMPGQQRERRVQSNSHLFKVEQPAWGAGHVPATCLVKMDSGGSGRRLWLADALGRCLYRFDKDLKLTDSVHTVSPAVGVDIARDYLLSCNIGIMNPNNGKFGSVQKIRFGAGEKMVADSLPLLSGLMRPVQVTETDINGDGQPDYLVCEFGHLTGALSWYERRENGLLRRHVIREVPGAIKTCIADANGDGRPDIWVLFSQADEGIFLFTNQGNGKFSQQQVLRFPPIYGSSSFELADFNKDGFPDIVYTCGDNADFSTVLKPYHGVYIYLNDGHNHFAQRYFFPVNGCYKAIARDFDGDGDLDLALIAFFADYDRQPEEGFLYLDNRGNWDFRPYSIPGTEKGRWLTMDAGDLDGDGKPDLVLGNFSIAPTMSRHAPNWKAGPSFVLLRNISGK